MTSRLEMKFYTKNILVLNQKGGHEHAACFTGSSTTTAGVLALSAAAADVTTIYYLLSLSAYPDVSVKNLLLPTYPDTCQHQVISSLAGILAMQLSNSNYYHIIASWRQFAFYCRDDET